MMLKRGRIRHISVGKTTLYLDLIRHIFVAVVLLGRESINS